MMTNAELRDSIAKDLYIKCIDYGDLAKEDRLTEHMQKWRNDVLNSAFDYADAFMAEKAKRDESLKAGRDYIGNNP